jgi:hypothetical protein
VIQWLLPCQVDMYPIHSARGSYSWRVWPTNYVPKASLSVKDYTGIKSLTQNTGGTPKVNAKHSLPAWSKSLLLTSNLHQSQQK